MKTFDRMEISDNIYEGVVNNYYKKSTSSESTCSGCSR